MAGWFVCLFVLPLITRPCSQLQSVSNFSKFVHPRFLLRCWLFYMPFCNALSSYFLKLKSFTQFDGNSDSLKFCKLFRDIAHLRYQPPLKLPFFPYLRFQRFQIGMLESFLLKKKNQKKILFLSKDIGGKRFFPELVFEIIQYNTISVANGGSDMRSLFVQLPNFDMSVRCYTPGEVKQVMRKN